MGAIKGATAAGRMGRAALSGAKSGALYGAGSAVSEGEGPWDIAKEAAKGGTLGAVLGGAGSGLIEGAGKVATRLGKIIRGAYDPEAEAARAIRGTMKADADATGGLGIDPEAYRAARQAGTPIGLIDTGGQATRDLGRAAANLSPQAWGSLERFTTERAEGRPERVRDTINRLFGGGVDAKVDQEVIKSQARLANRPAYARAYKAGDRPIWSPTMEQLAGSDAIQEAMKKAVSSGKDEAVRGGFGAFNPGVTVTPDGRLLMGQTLRGGAVRGVPTYPNIQYWDYVQRELSDMASKVEGREPAKFGRLVDLKNQLNSELDNLVPQFQRARQGAAVFFKAEDASEAGRKFVMMNADPREAQRAIAAMKAPERELFARGFADELAQTVMKGANTLGTIKRAFTSPLARQKIETAIGLPRAIELEAMLRAETIAQRSKDALGNSTTARQQELVKALKAGAHAGAHGVIGAGAVGAFELAKDTGEDLKSIAIGGLIAAAMSHGARSAAHKVDTRVFAKIGEMLASENPAVLRKGVQAVARSPYLFSALRNGTEAGARIAAHDIGPTRAAAGVAAMLEHVLSDGDGEHHGAHQNPAADILPQ
jgi:hypothetical protein